MTPRTTTANWAFRREIGNALGYEPSPYYDWAWLDGGKWNQYPAWDVDLNVAIELLKQMPLGAVGIDQDGETWFCSSYMDGAGVLADATADTPALAICKAFLTYMQPADE